MTLPKTVTVGNVTYEIKATKEAIATVSVKCRHELSGHCDYEAQVIALDPDMGPDTTKEVLVHELLHAACRAAGADPVEDDDKNQEERYVLPMAPSLLLVLRQNPSLVKYLTG